MTERVEKLLKNLKSKEYRSKRIDNKVKNDDVSTEELNRLFCELLKDEEPVIFEGDRIGFNRFQKNALAQCTSWGNFAPCYDLYLSDGFGKVYESLCDARKNNFGDSVFVNCAIQDLEAVFELCGRYKEAANGDLKKALESIPYNAPKSYYEALVMIKIIIFTLRLYNTSHVTLGRFDQYMYPFYKADIEKGMSKEEILELTEEFFISINVDSDIYYGVQQGDNGQSLMLGGFDEEGNYLFNDLSEICMKASMELNLIDPKINIRVGKKTPDDIYLLGTQMTKLGLGFPQYCNDDVVVPGLIEKGYSKEDAYNYSVAACWEFIVPNNYDIPNIRTLNFPMAVNNAVYNDLKNASDFDEFMCSVRKSIDDETQKLIDSVKNYVFTPSTYFSLFIKDCVTDCVDYSDNKKDYRNFGFHGAGIANAADALAAIKKTIFEDKSLTADELINALDKNFEGCEKLRNMLLACPKMGNNDDYADSIACDIMGEFCSYLKDKKNDFGGVFRPGTGSAMEYILSARKVGATADGRLAYTPFSSSFSPAITTHPKGLLSVIQSFTKFDMKKIINGGPLTVEIHDNIFRNDEGAKKVAELVKLFVELGGQQLQLNSINRDTLLDAQKHPEDYPNLIVRVWGWSGYFNELDIEYQNHIIARTEFQL